MNERDAMLKTVQMYHFMMTDLGLFLDSHPDNADALQYFKKYSGLYQQAMQNYSAKYGPLNYTQLAADATRFDWVNGPWPWEQEN